MPLPRIPIDDLLEPPKNTWVQIGFVFAHDCTMPVMVTTSPEGIQVQINQFADNLGNEIEYISKRLTAAQVETLKTKKDGQYLTVKLPLR